MVPMDEDGSAPGPGEGRGGDGTHDTRGTAAGPGGDGASGGAGAGGGAGASGGGVFDDGAPGGFADGGAPAGVGGLPVDDRDLAGGGAVLTGTAAHAARNIETALHDAELAWESPRPGVYVTQLPGTRKLFTTCQLIVGRHTVSLNAFVVRHPDENHEAFYRWMLERNLRLYGVSYAIDPLGDVYLTGRLPLGSVTPEEVDRLLGAVAENADGPFNTLLELGFASAIRREYAWRVSRGESTRNLAAFSHLTGEEAG